ncbi:hypothetical protein OHC33_008091 [Knufia fluminis]|uniref:Uncharacterized protein n=1 Tax=Knufia fluminis TaxID=191047 RepID=A0AAN8I429_9EURO|nr:hypothetical protein OHC33_008091 [Knufia fluminis]
MADIEAQRLANLQNKEKLLAELNLNSRAITSTKSQTVKRENGLSTKKRKIEVADRPTRSSARIQQAGERPSYKEEPDSVRATTVSRVKVRTRPNANASASVTDLKEEVRLSPAPDVETMRENWSKWEAEGSAPNRDEVGAFHFEDFPLFVPNKSPEEMIREGCFGGSYWRPLKSRRLGIVIEDDWKELPPEWTEGLDVHGKLTSPDYDADVNKYKVACGQSIEGWEASGWIMHEYDVRGWFQWYCRFFQGRRCPDDDRQVSRWRKCVGPTGRWKRMLLKAYLKQGVREVFDDGEDEDTREVSPVMHQTCHHWAYEIKQHDLDDAWQSTG